MDKRKCTNCYLEYIDESKQTFTYRDYMGIKHDSCISPICKLCIEAGELREESGHKKLYLTNKRLCKSERHLI